MLIKGFRGVVRGPAGPASGENRRRGVETARAWTTLSHREGGGVGVERPCRWGTTPWIQG